MNESLLFCAISQESQHHIENCLHAQTVKYPASGIIFPYEENADRIAVLVSGKARVYSVDANGDYALIELLRAGDVFGEYFTRPVPSLSYIAQADTECGVQIMRASDFATPCENDCECHRRLLKNLADALSAKNRQSALHISVLGCKSARAKLMTFLNYQRDLNHSDRFRIDMTLTDLALYLNIDRSSLMRQIRLMRAEGVIENKGRTFHLLTQA